MPEDWATADDVQSLDVKGKPKKLAAPGSHALSVDSNGQVAVAGGSDGTGHLYSLSTQKALSKFQASGPINDVLCIDLDSKQLVITAAANGEVAVSSDGQQIASFKEHAGSANAVALHSCGDILLSVGEDKSYVLYDLTQQAVLTRVFTNSRKLNEWSQLLLISMLTFFA